MHVLIVPSDHYLTPRYPLGGIFQHHQALALAGAGHRVGVLAAGAISPRFLFRPYRYAGAETVAEIHVLRKYARRFGPQRYGSPAASAAWHSRLALGLYARYERRHGRPDIIHAHNLLFAGTSARAIGEAAGVPFVVTEHSSAFAIGSMGVEHAALIADTAARAASVTAVSTDLARRVAALAHSVRVSVLPNVLDAEFARRARTDAIEAGGPCRFLAVGALDENKNQQLMIHAFAASFKATRAELRIGGDGPQRAPLERLARDLGVEDQVRLLGPLSRAHVREEMERSHCLLLTSRYETFGVVLIEAMACGTPVIATRCGGPEDIVRDITGTLVPRDDRDALAAAMAGVDAARGAIDRRGVRAMCLERYGEPAFVRQANELYREALTRGQG